MIVARASGILTKLYIVLQKINLSQFIHRKIDFVKGGTIKNLVRTNHLISVPRPMMS